MKNKSRLQIQLIFVILLLLVISNVGFAVMIFYANEEFEQQLLEAQINREMEQYTNALAEDGSTPYPKSANLSFYLKSNDDIYPVPPPFLEREPGIYHGIKWGDKDWQLGVRDMGNDRIYMALDISNFENREAKLGALLSAGALTIPVIALSIGFWLLLKIMRPVNLLAERVGGLDPKQRHVRIGPGFQGYEVERIATAFDRYLEKMDEYVEHEQLFSAAASHELRTPLAVIATSSELIADTKGLPENIRNLVQRIRRAEQGMSSLISALLFLARSEETTEDESVAETEVGEVLRKVAETHQLLISDRKITLTVNCDRPCFIKAPPDHLGIVVSNLLRNSIFHTKAGLISVRLEGTRIIVSDSGDGIVPQDLGKIFIREYRGKNSKGYGLGLYIAKSICDRHGWSLSLSSETNRGTVAILDIKSENGHK
ncbi:MAG TPA: HAMP domain-containing sensor histidine kinase [Gammaproteobacteria bacterium]|nr:HAMP domain-containing sensor histidine kinase [Gammaproteobacteria bacterium]